MNVISEKATCDLCGLPLAYGSVVCKEFDAPLYFCCNGCRQVYLMLMAASDDSDPRTFKDTDLYKRCVAAGIIPKSTEDLQKRHSEKISDHGQIDAHIDAAGASSNATHADTGLPLDLRIQGMWCPACAWVIEETLLKHPGVLSATCRFTTDRIKLSYNPVKTSPPQILSDIKKLGYHGMPAEADSLRSTYRKTFIRLGISAFLTMNVMMLSFALYTGFFTQMTADTFQKLTWPIVAMSAIVYFYGGGPIHRKGLSGLRAASPVMETLISIGASSAFFYSLYNWTTGSIHLYFDTASMLITLVLIGKTIEQRTKERINARIGNFLDLQPSKVRICTASFPQGRYVDAKMLSPGDVFRVDAGEVVPADGRILEGHARVDESTLTGEARPIRKQRGEAVSSGTSLVSGTLRVTARAVGKDSLLGQLVAVMDASLDSKSNTEGITDKAIKYFVPAIIVLAAITAVVCLGSGLEPQHAIIRAVTVLVISCPCALGVAIPLARVVGISLAARKGILVHHFAAFDQISHIDSVVFDKTGTITSGKWQLIKVEALDDWTPENVLSLAAGLELHATHYAGDAIVHAAREKKIPPATVTQVKESDNGISGYAGDVQVRIGSAAYISEDLKADARFPDNTFNRKKAAGVSTVTMSVAGSPCALFHFGDAIRESSARVIQHLKDRGINLALISGDGQDVTRQTGRAVGISDCRGSLLPENKAEFIDKLRAQGHRVAMVGDGVNDVPALASADLGIAVHSANRIGKEASAITLMGNDPSQILTFEHLARQTSRTIHQNLVFTFFYNIISIPIAMSGLLNPLVAVTAMLMSSLSVTGNTLFLARRISPDRKANPR